MRFIFLLGILVFSLCSCNNGQANKKREQMMNTSIDGHISMSQNVRKSYDELLIQTRQSKIEIEVAKGTISEYEGKLYMLKYDSDVITYNMESEQNGTAYRYPMDSTLKSIILKVDN